MVVVNKSFVLKFEIFRDMKKIIILFVLLMGLLYSCKNDEIEYGDYKYTTGYFPYQYPIRTLVLGDYIYDNSNDNNHKFLISIAIGGVYTNTKDRVFDIAVEDSLCNHALFASTSDTIRLMPKEYYTLSSNKLTVPKGKYNGNVEVQLTDAFFNDPRAINLSYVIPVRIVGSKDVDSILVGRSSKTSPDPRIAADWDVVPKNFTMFAVNFINPYSGNFLHRGISVVKDASNAVLETNVYHTTYIVDNEIWNLTTSAKNQVAVNGNLHSSIFKGSFGLLLNFASDSTCTVTAAPGSPYTITGTGKFKKNADSWGNELRNAIHLSYQLSNGTNTYNATDTLVVRDRAVKLQTFVPAIF